MVDYSKWDKLSVTSSEDENMDTMVLDEYPDRACCCDECTQQDGAVNLAQGPMPLGMGALSNVTASAMVDAAIRFSASAGISPAALASGAGSDRGNERAGAGAQKQQHVLSPAGVGVSSATSVTAISEQAIMKQSPKKPSGAPSEATPGPGAEAEPAPARSEHSGIGKDTDHVDDNALDATQASAYQAHDLDSSPAAQAHAQAASRSATGKRSASMAMAEANAPASASNPATRSTFSPGTTPAPAVAFHALGSSYAAQRKTVSGRRASKAALGTNEIKKKASLSAAQKRRVGHAGDEGSTLVGSGSNGTAGHNTMKLSEMFSTKHAVPPPLLSSQGAGLETALQSGTYSAEVLELKAQALDLTASVDARSSAIEHRLAQSDELRGYTEEVRELAAQARDLTAQARGLIEARDLTAKACALVEVGGGVSGDEPADVTCDGDDAAATPSRASMDASGANVGGVVVSSPVPYIKRKQAHFVKLDERDDGEGLDSKFFGHPSTHIPVCAPDGRMSVWGIPSPANPHHDFSRKLRQLRTHGMYSSAPGKLAAPEVQYVRHLIESKTKQLTETHAVAAASGLASADFILRVSLCDVEPELFRVVKVSGNTTLSALQDKILCPVLGWTRNLHGYVFVSQQDGAVYGPKNAAYDDLMFMDQYGWESIDDSKVRLYDVLCAEKHVLHYVHDLEEGWWHRIMVQQIRAPSESTGDVVVVEGANACPPEEGRGMAHVNARGSVGFASALNTGALDCLAAGEAWNVHKDVFDPYDFTFEQVDMRLSEALAAPASVRYGSKRIFYRDDMLAAVMQAVLVPASNALQAASRSHMLHLLKDSSLSRCETPVLQVGHENHVLVTQPLWKDELDGPWVTEVVNKGRDSKRSALCNWCGNPNGLHLCGGCSRQRFCGRECQEDAWVAGHHSECRQEQPSNQ
ncbi:hypothetical protein FVE85_4551 [Porphyridium purpureum]|uniref:MYND-type domain-containing protein n=1 Tax=Porphyridium purpureum TaxID=35688 RepID=A0A5J4YK49_PORPP|nr:hypothetical protein FVE85_4551 [Porphyridium purpureum]|eukprot:POR3261..scf297_16